MENLEKTIAKFTIVNTLQRSNKLRTFTIKSNKQFIPYGKFSSNYGIWSYVFCWPWILLALCKNIKRFRCGQKRINRRK